MNWESIWAHFSSRVAEGNEIVLQEPTVAAIVIEEQKMVAWGQEAQDMLGKVPDSLEVTRPLINGVIADYEVTEYLLSGAAQKTLRSAADFWTACYGDRSLWGYQCRKPGSP